MRNNMITLAQMTFPKYLEKQFLEWQHKGGSRKTIGDFAAYLGVSQAVVSMWLSGARRPNQLSIDLLAKTFGLDVYDALGLPRPDADLHFLQQHWDGLSPEARRAIREKAEEYSTKNEAKRLSGKRRTRPSDR